MGNLTVAVFIAREVLCKVMRWTERTLQLRSVVLKTSPTAINRKAWRNALIASSYRPVSSNTNKKQENMY